MNKIAIKIKRTALALLVGVAATYTPVHAQYAAYTDIYVNSNASFSVFSKYAFSKPGTSIQSMVYTQRNNPGTIQFASSATWSGAADATCVDGYAKKVGSSGFTFPVGDNGAYRPMAMSNPNMASVAYFGVDPNSAVTSNAFSASTTYPALPTGAPFSTSTFGTLVNSVSSKEYWHVNGSSVTNVTLTWNSASDISGLTGGDLTNLTIVGWDGTKWVQIGSEIDANILDHTSSTPASSTSSSSLTSGSITSTSTIDLSDISILTFGTHSSFDVYAKVFMSGAYDAGSGLMRDSLRSQSDFPLTEPYSAYSSYTHSGNGGGEAIPTASASSILGATGSNAIVDWVFVEFRSKDDKTVVLGTASALVQRDGDIVSAEDGTSPITYKGLGDTTFYLAVRHRNHLGVMSKNAEVLTSSATVVDFTNGNSSLSGEFDYGTTHPVAGSSYDYTGYAQRAITGSVRGMWAGDGSQDGQVKYVGGSNDINQLQFDVVLHTGNTGFAYNYNGAYGYLLGDYDLSGKAKYVGSNNDVNVVQLNVVLHPLNTGYAYNFNLNLEQLP